jgi:hypothetical protein
MKLVAAVSIAFAVLVGAVALTAGGSSSDGDKVRNAAFATADDRSDPGIGSSEYRDPIGEIEAASLDEYDCLQLDRQDDRRLRFSRVDDLEIASGVYHDYGRADKDLNDLYERFKLLDKLKLLRPYRDAYGRDVETFRDLDDRHDLRDRLESMDSLADEYYFHEAMELLDRLREKC